jgi:hypothetical protein
MVCSFVRDSWEDAIKNVTGTTIGYGVKKWGLAKAVILFVNK